MKASQPRCSIRSDHIFSLLMHKLKRKLEVELFKDVSAFPLRFFFSLIQVIHMNGNWTEHTMGYGKFWKFEFALETGCQ